MTRESTRLGTSGSPPRLARRPGTPSLFTWMRFDKNITLPLNMNLMEDNLLSLFQMQKVDAGVAVRFAERPVLSADFEEEGP